MNGETDSGKKKAKCDREILAGSSSLWFFLPIPLFSDSTNMNRVFLQGPFLDASSPEKCMALLKYKVMIAW